MIPELHRRLPEPFFRRGIRAWCRLSPPRCFRKYGVPKPQDVICDVGAMFGEFAIPATQRAKHVYALEPGPVSIRRLRAAEFHLENLSAHQMAAWDSSETLQFDITDDPSEVAPSRIGSDVTPRTTYEVPAKPLADLKFIDDITFLKIDAEGAELEVVRGLGEHRPGRISVDTSPERRGERTTGAVRAWMLDAGYYVERCGDILSGRYP